MNNRYVKEGIIVLIAMRIGDQNICPSTYKQWERGKLDIKSARNLKSDTRSLKSDINWPFESDICQ